jgi:hypothetical protein
MPLSSSRLGPGEFEDALTMREAVEGLDASAITLLFNRRPTKILMKEEVAEQKVQNISQTHRHVQFHGRYHRCCKSLSKLSPALRKSLIDRFAAKGSIRLSAVRAKQLFFQYHSDHGVTFK